MDHRSFVCANIPVTVNVSLDEWAIDLCIKRDVSLMSSDVAELRAIATWLEEISALW
jgi:hypothetical protein